MAGAAPEKKPDEKSRPGVGRAPAGRFAVLAARFNESISKKLADGAASALEAGGVAGDCVEVHWVPGSFELPQAARMLARTGRYAGIVCVGVIIRGETPHFEYLSGAVAHGLSRVGLETGVPVSFGVITALTEAQAWERAGGAVGHRGEEAARAALEMAGFMRGLKAGRARARRR
jgi:6,7-dimethyl-8-ribityllumazine synthase